MKSTPKYPTIPQGEGIKSVPKGYHTLVIELAAHQAFNICPTTVKTILWYRMNEDDPDVPVMSQLTRYTDQPASLSIAWQFKQLRGIFRVQNKIDRPKKVVIRFHNLLTYLCLTGQLVEVYEFEQRTLRDKLKNFLTFAGNPICDLEYVDSDKNLANRFLDQSRGTEPANINATKWDTGEEYLKIFHRSMQNRRSE